MLGHGTIGQFAIGEAAQVTTAAPWGWLLPFSEPTRFKRGLGAARQQAFAFSPLPIPTPTPSFGWFAGLSDPAIRSRRGLGAALQQFLAWAPRLPVAFDITAQLNADETGDTFAGAGTIFNQPVATKVGFIELAPLRKVGLIETSS